MNSEDVKKAAQEMMGQYSPSDEQCESIADKLSSEETKNNIRLSAYGFVSWAVNHYGFKCAYKNLMASDQVVRGYADVAVKLRDDMPAMLVNAHMYVSKIMSNVADTETCFKQLEGMTFPYVLYVLFAGSGQQAVVERYKSKAADVLKCFPSTLDMLPESYKAVGKEFTDADA